MTLAPEAGAGSPLTDPHGAAEPNVAPDAGSTGAQMPEEAFEGKHRTDAAEPDLEQQAVDDLDIKELEAEEPAKLNIFQKWLTVWVLLAMGIGVIIGWFIPAVPETLAKATIQEVSIPIAVLLWGIILPMMLQVDFSSIVNVAKQPKGVILTCVVNYAIQPFTMYGIALLFFQVIFIGYLGQAKASQYIIGSVLLGSAPCTAMVFVWSRLMRGDPGYTVTQVAINDLILLATYVPTVKLLANSSDIYMPWSTLFLSVGFFVVIPLVVGVTTRYIMSRKQSWFDWLNLRLIPILDNCSMVFLVLMVVLLFIGQAATLVHNFVDILIIAVPLLIQTFLIWGLTYGLALLLKLPYNVAGPATLIAASNFFEMAVAIAVSVYGTDSGAALATVVGVLIEVPVMLLLVYINNRTQHLFAKKQK